MSVAPILGGLPASLANATIVPPNAQSGANSSLSLSAKGDTGDTVSYSWVVGGMNAGGINTGQLQLFRYVNGAFNTQSIKVSTDGVVQFPDTTQCGVATILAGAATFAVANTAITANSVVLLTPQLNDATAVRVAAVLNPGVGFTITAPANATANLPVSWFIARY